MATLRILFSLITISLFLNQERSTHYLMLKIMPAVEGTLPINIRS
jgi:hypothetical protein